MYELLIGITPFYNKDPMKMLQRIKMAKLFFPNKAKYDIQYCDEFMDIVSKLLDKNRLTRLGSGPGDWKEVLAHPFFKNFDI